MYNMRKRTIQIRYEEEEEIRLHICLYNGITNIHIMAEEEEGRSIHNKYTTIDNNTRRNNEKEEYRDNVE